MKSLNRVLYTILDRKSEEIVQKLRKIIITDSAVIIIINSLLLQLQNIYTTIT